MIEVCGLSKSFKERRKKARSLIGLLQRFRSSEKFFAVKDVSFCAESGTILGLLGPNGAGKTTLLRMLSTALKPSAGTANIDGVDLVKNPLEVRKIIGFLSDNTGLYGRLTAREMIEYYGKLHGLDSSRLHKRMDELFGVLEMTDFVDKRNDSLSSGMKQKVSIARTLINDPDVIMFDEPTTGLDVAAAEAILKFIESCKDRGKTVIFCTHHMHEVDRLCDKVVVLDAGRVCFDGTIEKMHKQTGQSRMDKAFLAVLNSGRAYNAA
ncbi:MAG: ATP-binding cassette domain-containing protein [Sedimentisphaerales bacterium]|nr:ATP-binding cassette domain-containing protein [Sedimentisphaerales bacterium]